MKHAQVLVLSAYHAGYGGTDPMVEGIKTAFENSGQEADFYLEYLDTKRFPLPVVSPYLKQLYKEKFAQTEFDVIIVADNNGFNFIRKVRDEIFPGVPVVFCGINNFQYSMLEGLDKVTGVAEDISLQETVDLALTIHPDTKYLAVISDSTTTGFANMEKFLEIKEDLPVNLVTLDLSNLSAAELAEKLKSLPPKTILLQLSFYMDSEGRQFSQKEQMEFIRSYSDKPIYSAWDFFINYGVTGGVVTYFPLQGQTAGEMAIKIINGVPVEDIPVVTKSPNIPLFDAAVLKHLGISTSSLPLNSVFLNVPESFLQKNKDMVLGTLLFLVLLLIVIVGLLVAMKRQKKTSALLLESERAYRNLFENMAEGAFYQTRDGILSHVNSAALEMFGLTLDQFIGKSSMDPDWKVINEEGSEITGENHPSMVALRTGEPCREVVAGVYNPRKNDYTWVAINAIPQFRDNEKEAFQVFVTIHDITDRKYSEELLRIEHDLLVQLSDVKQRHDGLEICLDSALHGSGMDAGGIYLYDDKRESLDLICHRGLGEEFVKRASLIEPGSDRYNLVMQKKAVYTNYTDFSKSFYETDKLDGLRAICVIPIVYQNELVGCLNLASHTKTSMPDYTRMAIETIAGQIGSWVKHYNTMEILSESEDRFTIAMGAVSDGLFDWNLTDNSVYYSPNWKRMLGYDEHEIKNELFEWERLTDDNDAQQAWVQLEKLIERKLDRFEGEFKMRHKDGHWVDILARAKAIFDADGKAVRVIGTHVDITERKKNEKLLIEQKQAAERYLKLAGVMFIGLDKDGCVTLANEKACQVLGAENDEIIGKNWFETYLPEKMRYDIRSVHSQLMIGPLESAEYNENLIITKNGQEKCIAWHNTVLKDDQGQVIGVLASGEDITEKRELQFKLQEVQKMESIGTLAGGIAHDFNNILSSILGFTELSIEDVEKGSEIESNLLEVYAAGKRARDLVKQILTFARRSDDEIKPIQPKAIVGEVLQFIRSSIPTSIVIQQELLSDALIMGNATQMHRVLMNICTNSAYVMEDDGGILSVSMKDVVAEENAYWGRLGLKSGNYIELTISDTGSGIDPSSLGKIFDPYYTTKGPGEGTGLGLALVHGIVESYGGKIKVDSTVGKGTIFTLYLPSTKRKNADDDYIKKQLPRGSERVLFVDDEPSLVTVGTRMLEQLGYEVKARTNSIEALELFKKNPEDFDVVVSDMTMPNLTGDKLAVELMKIRRDIPVIIYTGYSKKMSSNLIKEIGIKAVEYKPLVKADLAKTLRKILDRE